MGDSPWANCPETMFMLIIQINNYYANTTVITNHILNLLYVFQWFTHWSELFAL